MFVQLFNDNQNFSQQSHNSETITKNEYDPSRAVFLQKSV